MKRVAYLCLLFILGGCSTLDAEAIDSTITVTTVAVLCFLGSWNDLLVALLWLPDPAQRTISVGVATLQGVRSNSMDLILTGSLFSAIPPIAAFIIFQRYLVSGIVSGMGK